MGDIMRKSVLKDKVFLRKLELTDAKPMLEWMTDPDIYKNMQYDPKEQNLEKCSAFIQNSWEDKENLHCAITNEQHEYLGTVSLKNIDRKNQNAEFAIALCPKAMGKGISAAALREIMKKAFEELNLNKVYLYVRSDNQRAVAFYKKNHLTYEGCFAEHLCVEGDYKDIYWFSLRKKEYEKWKSQVSCLSC